MIRVGGVEGTYVPGLDAYGFRGSRHKGQGGYWWRGRGKSGGDTRELHCKMVELACRKDKVYSGSFILYFNCLKKSAVTQHDVIACAYIKTGYQSSFDSSCERYFETSNVFGCHGAWNTGISIIRHITDAQNFVWPATSFCWRCGFAIDPWSDSACFPPSMTELNGYMLALTVSKVCEEL